MTLLEVRDLTAGYGPAEVLHGVSLRVEEAEIVVVLGANGAGKTTTMRAIAGLIGRKGTVNLDGASIIGLSRQGRGGGRLARAAGPRTFAKLSVDDNLHVGAAKRRDRQGIKEDLARWYEVFPVLASRRKQMAGTLSGGEQQMLAVARALMSRPRLLLCDEPSLASPPDRARGLQRPAACQHRAADGHADRRAERRDRPRHREPRLPARGRRSGVRGTAESLRESDAVRRAYLGY